MILIKYGNLIKKKIYVIKNNYKKEIKGNPYTFLKKLIENYNHSFNLDDNSLFYYVFTS